MNALKNKIKSQRGASITFALLLFLVCAVVSIVVVVAGSAAAGRMSQRAETDQRYYAVTSAVELLCDDFKGKTVKAEFVSENKTPKPNVSMGDINVDITDKNSILAAATRQLVFKLNNPDPEIPSVSPDDTLTLVVASGAPDGSALGCTINEYVKKDGRVIFEVSNDTDPKYTLQAVFDANITQSVSQYTDAENGKPMESITTTLVWSVNSIKKGTVQ